MLGSSSVEEALFEVVFAIYLDPDTTHLLAERQTEDGKPYYTRLFIERRIATSLPDETVRMLGTDREEKSIQG